jgi:hypothetical protein
VLGRAEVQGLPNEPATNIKRLEGEILYLFKEVTD